MKTFTEAVSEKDQNINSIQVLVNRIKELKEEEKRHSSTK